MTRCNFFLLEQALLFSSVLFFLLFLDFTSGATTQHVRKWTHDMKLPSSLDIKWTIEDDTYMTMQIKAPTQGYVGVGFSPAGGMGGADIILGWVDDDGVPHLKDYYGTTNGVPIEDDQQDIELLEAEQNEEGTRFIFRRKWDTCDTQHDIAIGGDTMKFIWAWSPTDPKDNKDLHWHGSGLGRGVRGIFMKHQGMVKGFPDEDSNYENHPNIKHWDIKIKNYIVPKIDTQYHCRIFKLPKFTKKHHVIAHRPLLTEESRKYVHHMNIVKCQVPKGLKETTSQVFEQYLTHPGADCFGTDMPVPWKQYCVAFMVAFGVGSEGDILPDYLGDPIEPPEDGDIYVKMEVHYDNPLRLPLNDSSGVRIFYTDKLREYEVAVLFSGHRRTPFMTIPPFQNRFKIAGFCPPECTQNGLPPTGIKLYSVLLHSHLNGRSMILRHIRNGVELEPIAQDNHYDFTYQQYRVLKDQRVILPGDELIVECDYETIKNENFVFGGLSTRQEMCEAFIIYYPKTTMFDCRSQPEFYSYFDALEIRNVSGSVLKTLSLPYHPSTDSKELAPPDDVYVLEYGQSVEKEGDIFGDLKITSPSKMAEKYNSVHEEMKSLNWKDGVKGEQVQNHWINGPHYMHCSQESGARLNKEHIKYIQKYEPFVQTHSNAQCLGETSGTGTMNLTGLSILLLAFASFSSRFFS